MSQVVFASLLLIYAIGGTFLADVFGKEIRSRGYTPDSTRGRYIVAAAYIAVLSWPA